MVVRRLVASMAPAFTEAFQPQHVPEGKRQIKVQVQQFVAGVCKRSRDKPVQTAEQPVFQLNVVTVQRP